MSLPKSRILSTNKGFSAAAELHNNSPEQNTVVNVNVHQPSAQPAPQPNETQQPLSPATQPQITTETTSPASPPPNPYATVDSGEVQYVQERSAKESLDELQALIQSKDNIINAYSLMIDILENNPLIINKYVIADIESLTLLIQYLTEAERVDIQESLDIDCSCAGQPKYVGVDKIYITKNGDTQNFKYQYPNANKVLDDHHISVKFVVDKSK